MPARWSALVAVGVLGMIVSALPVRSAEEPKKPRILMLTLSKGFEHGSVKRKSADELSVSEVAVTQLAQATGEFTVHCTKDIADFTKDNLQKYDLVLFYTTGNLGIDKETLDYFEEGAKELAKRLPATVRVEFRRWRQRTGGEKFHNRYVLSDLGGVMLGTGLDAGDVGETDDLLLLPRAVFERRWEQYVRNDGSFEEVDKPSAVTGSRT